MTGSNNVVFRAGPDERRKLERMAAGTGLTASAILRLLIRNAELGVVRMPVNGQPLTAVGDDSSGAEVYQTNAAAVA